MSDIKKVYHYLKHHQGSGFEDIAARTKLPSAAVKTVLDNEVKKEMIELKGQRYFVNYPLHGWVDRRIPNQIWSYPKILARTQKALVSVAPDIYRNPLWDKLIRFFQGGEGDCVAAAGLYIRELLYMMLTGQIIEGEVLRDQTYGKTTYDIRPGFSAACIYIKCKELAHMNLASPGCYVSRGAEAMTKFGVCLDKQWFCATDGMTFWTTPFPDTVENVAATAALHKLDGFALLNPYNPKSSEPPFNLFRQTVSSKGCMYGAIPIYENFMAAGKNVKGEFISDLPDPDDEIIGWHALAWIGYNALTKRFEYLSSWKGWTFLGSVSEKYLRMAIGDFLALLDASEVLIGQEIFQKIDITCNVPATVTMNDVPSGTTPLTVRLEKGKTYHMKFEALGYVPKEQDVTVTDGLTNIDVTLTAVPPPVEPTKSFLQQAWEFLLSLWKRVTG